MKKQIICCIFLLAAPIIKAQVNHVSWSAQQNCDHEMIFLGISTDTTQSFYALYGNHEKYPVNFNLDIFDADLSFSKNLSITLPAGDDNNPRFYDARVLGVRYCLFATYVHKPDNGIQIHYLYAYPVTENGIEDKIELGKIEFSDEKKTGDFKIAFSESGDYVSVLSEIPGEENTPENITLSVFNQQLIKQYTKEFSFDIDYKRNIHNYLFCANNGQTYIVKKDRDKNAFRYLVYSINAQTNLLAGKPLNLPGKHVTDIRACTDKTGNLRVGGFTSSEPVHEYTGYFITSFDSNLTQVYKTMSIFETSDLEKILGKKASKNPVLQSFFIDRVITLPGGQSFIISEEQSHLKTDKKTEISYGQVLILAFDKDGKYLKTEVIKKNQKATPGYGDFGSYNVYTKNDSLFIICNSVSDDLINKSGKVTGKSFLSTRIYIISPKNALSQINFPDYKEIHTPLSLAFDPEYVYLSVENSVIMRFVTGDRKKYSLVTFYP
jgi:hypothetical protein